MPIMQYKVVGINKHLGLIKPRSMYTSTGYNVLKTDGISELNAQFSSTVYQISQLISAPNTLIKTYYIMEISWTSFIISLQRERIKSLYKTWYRVKF